MSLILLPGMDGTGLLFEPFIAQAPINISIKPIALRHLKDLGYAEQANHVLGQIGDEPAIIVAESYSGRIAYEMARISPTTIKHIVFAASFLARPSFLARFAQLTPIHLLKGSILPRTIMGKLAFGNANSPQLAALLHRALSKVDGSVLRHRLKQIKELKTPPESISVPCTYIRAKSDRLISRRAVDVFKNTCSNLDIKNVEGSHFILQTNPSECWRIVKNLLL